jgi:Dolichyl-phosphate-mannose-protein mannosyltransferase
MLKVPGAGASCKAAPPFYDEHNSFADPLPVRSIMANTRPFRFIDLIYLLLVLLIAGAARAGYLFVYADKARTVGPLLVQDPPSLLRDLPPAAVPAGEKPPNELEALAHNIKENNWFGTLAPFAKEEERTAHYSPGYPWLLGLLAKMIDAASLDSTVRWIQCGLGVLTAGLYFLFARRAFYSRTVALLTGLFCAVYPFWVISTAEINDGVLTSFLLGLCLYLAVRAIQVNGAFASLLYGLTLAGLSLVRAATLPFTFVALAWFLYRSRKESRGWLCALLAFLGFANGLAPWAVRNYQVFKEPVPIVSSAWLHLWIGNNPHATGGPLTEEMWFSAPASELLEEKEQPRRYTKLAQHVLDEVRSHPVATIQRRVHAWLDFWMSERFFTDKRVADETGEPQPANTELILNAALFAMLFLALLGWRWTYGWRKDSMPSSLALLWIPLPYFLSHAEALHGPRLPLDGILLCYAAFALVCFVPGLGGDLLDACKPAEVAEEE